MPNKKYFIFIILIIIGITIIYLTGLGEEVPQTPSRVQVKLYFSTRDAMYLKAEVREINEGDLYLKTLEELIRGPVSPDMGETIPEGTRVLGINVNNGVAYPNFSSDLIKNHWGGSTGETMTVYSIVNTLSQFPEVESVQILIEGEKIETLAGHIYMLEPLKANQDLILKE